MQAYFPYKGDIAIRLKIFYFCDGCAEQIDTKAKYI